MESPVDLSTKVRSVSVQTDMVNLSGELRNHLLQLTIDLLVNKNNYEKFNKNIFNLISGIKKSQVCMHIYKYLLEVKLHYDSVCSSVGWLVGRSVVRSDCQKFLKGWEFSVPSSYRSTCFIY